MAGVVAIVGRANVGNQQSLTVWLEKEFQLLKMLQV